jgi:hypothetical protein
MRTSFLASLTSILAASAAVAHADVRVVAPTGAPFTEIQAAVDAANDGDVVLVKAGTYASFVIRNQEVAVIADTGHVVLVDGAIRVSGVGATRSVLIVGLKATGRESPSASTRHGLFARNCAGSLRIVGCELRGAPLNTFAFGPGPQSNYPQPLPSCYEGQGAWVERCADVAFVGCTLQGSDAQPTLGYGGFGTRPYAGATDGGHGIYGDSSQIALLDSTFHGGRSGLGYGFGPICEPAPFAGPATGYMGIAGDGCRTQSSFVFASACTFTGAAGWPPTCLFQCFCEAPSDGGHGFVNDAAPGPHFRLDGALVPGMGAPPNGSPCPCGIGGNFCNPNDPPGIAGQPSQGPVTTLAGSARRMTGPSVVREGAQATVTFHGEPGDRVELFVNDRPGFLFLLGLRGVNLVQRTRPMLAMQVGTIGTGGTLVHTWTVGDLGAGVEARVQHMQAVMTDGAGVGTLSSPLVITLLDSAF